MPFGRAAAAAASSPDIMVHVNGFTVQKLAEFARLGYPRGLLRQQCSKMAVTQGTYEWIRVLLVLDWEWRSRTASR